MEIFTEFKSFLLMIPLFVIAKFVRNEFKPEFKKSKGID